MKNSKCKIVVTSEMERVEWNGEEVHKGFQQLSVFFNWKNTKWVILTGYCWCCRKRGFRIQCHFIWSYINGLLVLILCQLILLGILSRLSYHLEIFHSFLFLYLLLLFLVARICSYLVLFLNPFLIFLMIIVLILLYILILGYTFTKDIMLFHTFTAAIFWMFLIQSGNVCI